MAKKKVSVKAKAKSSKRAAKDSEQEMPDLVAVMTKITERLESLETKMEQVIQQTAGNQRHAQPQQHRPQPQSQPREPRSPQQQAHSHSQAAQNQNSNPQRGNRPLYQAVCADCQKKCEVPFMPTAERPVYCKECFAGRKAQRPSQKNSGNSFQPQAPQQRQVKVFPNGVGKVTISELVTAGQGNAAPRSQSPSRKPRARR